MRLSTLKDSGQFSEFKRLQKPLRPSAALIGTCFWCRSDRAVAVGPSEMDCTENIDDFWNWQEEPDYSFQNIPHNEPDFGNLMLEEINQNNEDSIAYIFDEKTPIKNCIAEPIITDDNDKRSGEFKEFSQSKRRRMLHFESDPIVSSMNIGELSDNILQSQVDHRSLVDEMLNDVIGHENLDCSQWFDNNDNQFKMPLMLTSQADIDISDICNISPVAVLESEPEREPNDMEIEAVEVSKIAKPSACIRIKGLKTMIETPKKLITKTAYPFAIIKPSCVQGEVTLKDINQKIHNPPPKPEKPKEDEELYPTSAFSGKPVVSKMMIRTEGKGSITIMRTKG